MAILTSEPGLDGLPLCLFLSVPTQRVLVRQVEEKGGSEARGVEGKYILCGDPHRWTQGMSGAKQILSRLC